MTVILLRNSIFNMLGWRVGSKHEKYFGQVRIRSIGLPVPIPYPKCNNATEIEKDIHVGKYIQTIIVILNNLNGTRDLQSLPIP
ncbi:MAG TPA: hypothetical protein VFV86_12810 [Nitrososphaeraceae archaeon]|nr:hypothetical protein [Nitrososphaeraceae archaeon]